MIAHRGNPPNVRTHQLDNVQSVKKMMRQKLVNVIFNMYASRFQFEGKGTKKTLSLTITTLRFCNSPNLRYLDTDESRCREEFLLISSELTLFFLKKLCHFLHANVQI